MNCAGFNVVLFLGLNLLSLYALFMVIYSISLHCHHLLSLDTKMIQAVNAVQYYELAKIMDYSHSSDTKSN
jgi:hypothetical protein